MRDTGENGTSADDDDAVAGGDELGIEIGLGRGVKPAG